MYDFKFSSINRILLDPHLRKLKTIFVKDIF